MVRRNRSLPVAAIDSKRPTLSADIVERVLAAREGGGTWSSIARELNDDGVPTAQGGVRWYPATVRYVALGAEAAA